MSMPDFITIKRWVKQCSASYQYYNRVLRAVAVRILLRLCRIFFRIEQCINPICKDGQQRILIIIIGGMGDCLLFDPLFKRLKERWPRAVIDVLTGSFEQMWAQIESVDNLILFRPTKFKSPWAYGRLFRTIHRRAYDIVAEGIAMVPKRGIYPLLTSFIMQASGAPIRIGRKNTGRLEALRPRLLDFIGHAEMMARKKHRLDLDTNPFLTHIIKVPPPDGREFHESAYIFEPLGVPHHRKLDEPGLLSDPRADRWAHAMLRRQWGKTDDLLIAMTLETTRQIKAWPLECFMHILDKGVRDNYKFVMLGLDRDRAGEISSRFAQDKVINLAGCTDLAEMTALIRQCDVFLSCDTGPAHIAQACRIPTVVLFGPSNEKEFGPIDKQLHTLVLPPEDVKCRPCVLGPCVRGKSCVQLIRPETVYQALKNAVIQARHHRQDRRSGQRGQAQKRLCEI
jgi:ADP-heptose:LPS heptosyltransferase